MYWGCIGDVLGMYWGYIGDVLGMYWGSIGDLLGIYWRCIGDMVQLGIFGAISDPQGPILKAWGGLV